MWDNSKVKSPRSRSHSHCPSSGTASSDFAPPTITVCLGGPKRSPRHQDTRIAKHQRARTLGEHKRSRKPSWLGRELDRDGIIRARPPLGVASLMSSARLLALRLMAIARPSSHCHRSARKSLTEKSVGPSYSIMHAAVPVPRFRTNPNTHPHPLHPALLFAVVAGGCARNARQGVSSLQDSTSKLKP